MQNILNPATVSSRVEKIIKIIFLSVFVLGLEGASRVGAVGFRLPNQDPEAIARGNAFAATADDPDAIYYNPAGITQLQGYNLSLGVYSISANTEYKSPSGATASTDAELQEVPQIYFVDAPTNQSLSFGLGIYAPYGLSLDWGNKAPFKTVAESGSLI